MRPVARQTPIFVSILFVFAAGCSPAVPTPAPSPAPAVSRAPSPAPPPAGPSGTGTIAGFVVDEDGRPIAGAGVSVWSGRYVPLYGGEHTDASGAFQQNDMPYGANVWLVAFKAPYVQPCAVPLDRRLDGPARVQLVRSDRVDAWSVPPSPEGFRTITGVVVQATSAGNRPVSGVGVFFNPAPQDDDWVAANTVTDGNGRFALCGMPQEPAWITASIGQQFVNVTARPGQTEIEIVFQ